MASKIKIRVSDNDRGWNKLRNEVFGPSRNVTIGVHGDDDSRKGGRIGNVELMTVHEFGSERAGIPERSVIRLTFDRSVNEYRRLITAVGARIYALQITANQALELIGVKVASDMRRTIDRTPGEWPALDPATLRSREYGGTKPLIDRKELQRSIQHKVNR